MRNWGNFSKGDYFPHHKALSTVRFPEQHDTVILKTSSYTRTLSFMYRKTKDNKV